MLVATREERYSEKEVKEILKKVFVRNNLAVFKCLDRDSVVYTLGDAVGIVAKDFKIVEKVNNDYFIDRLDIYASLTKEEEAKLQEPVFKLLKVDNIQAAKIFTGVLAETNKATVTHMKCLDGTFTYNNLTMEGAATLLEKFITTTRFDDVRTLFHKIKSSGWSADIMAKSFIAFLRRNEKELNAKPKDREAFLSQLKVLYPKHINQFNEALGILPPVAQLNIFDEPRDVKVVYIDQKLIAQRFVIPFVDATIESGYYNAMMEFIKFLNTEDGLELVGAKSFEMVVGSSAQKGKWVIMIRTTDDFSMDLFQTYIIKCFEKLVFLATQNKTASGGASGVNSHYLLMGMDKLYASLLESAIQEVMMK